MTIPTDPYFGNQWQLNGPFGINVAAASDDFEGAGVIVAVFDDGIQGDHPDLAANFDAALSAQLNPDNNNGLPLTAGDNHGTAVAGLIAAAENGIGGVGVAPHASLVSIRQSFDVVDLDRL